MKSNQNERAHLLKESQCVIDEYIAETKNGSHQAEWIQLSSRLAKM